MKITFLCGSLEPGKDGVGDYSRGLAAELIRQGHSASIISLRDRHIQKDVPTKEIQFSRGTKVECLRLESSLSWKRRMSETGDFLKSREPNWISLQFVPYAYHLKGLPFRLPEVLDQLNKKFPVNWHIMFHEIGDDFGKGLALKDYLMAFFQKRIIIRLHRKLNILVSSTHSQTYRNSLKKWYPGIVKSLPLFSNINTSFAESKRASSLLGLDKANRKDYLIGLFFGNIQPFRAFSDSLKQFVIAAESRNLVPFIVHMGRLSLRYEQAWATATATLPEGVLVKRLGELPEKDVSSMIHLIDIGMSTTPWTLAEKSGGAYPFLEAGKHVWFLQDPLPGSPPLSEGFSKDIDVCIRNAPFLRPSLSVVAKTFLDQVSAAVR